MFFKVIKISINPHICFDSKLRQKLLELFLPVINQAGRTYHKKSAFLVILLAPFYNCRNQGHCLMRFTNPHIIAKKTRKPISIQKPGPFNTIHLIGS